MKAHLSSLFREGSTIGCFIKRSRWLLLRNSENLPTGHEVKLAGQGATASGIIARATHRLDTSEPEGMNNRIKVLRRMTGEQPQRLPEDYSCIPG